MVETTTVYVCSNPNCNSVFDHNPSGHCPVCMNYATNFGWATVRHKILDPLEVAERKRAEHEAVVAKTKALAAERLAKIPPVDRANVTLADGSPVTPDHREVQPNGQLKGYIVLSDEERAKGFVRPVRRTYLHVGHNYELHGEVVLTRVGKDACGTRTTMSQAIAETYARDPYFYGSTFCCSCNKHLPLDEFIWEGTNEKVGS